MFKGNVGEKYNLLTIVESIHPSSDGHLVVKCKCNCGKTKTVRYSNLISGNIKPCECEKPKPNIIGKRYGSLIIKERAGYFTYQDKHNKLRKRPLVKCTCDCGNEIIVQYENLTGGGTQSCGCSHIKYKNVVGEKYGT